jgi:hypothetical protein
MIQQRNKPARALPLDRLAYLESSPIVETDDEDETDVAMTEDGGWGSMFVRAFTEPKSGQ